MNRANRKEEIGAKMIAQKSKKSASLAGKGAANEKGRTPNLRSDS